MVDLLLRIALDGEGHRFVEFELRTAVQADEWVAVKLELDRHDASGRPRAALRVARDRADLPAPEDRGVELRRFLGLPVEPEEGLDFLGLQHRSLLFQIPDSRMARSWIDRRSREKIG